MPTTPPASGSPGRLELTWANKDRRLLAHDDVTYEWVDPADWRVSEVRLLDEVGTYGESAPDNLLIHGDSLHALTALSTIPEYAERYLGNIRLCYIDLPFNTGQTFQHYDDNLEHSVWLTMLRDRLEQIHRLLTGDGSVWVHVDDAEAHRARCVLDEVFGAENFIATVIWEKTHTRENRSAVSVGHEYIHGYAKARGEWAGTRNTLPASPEQLARYTNPDNDERGPWSSMPAHAKAEKGRRQEQFFTITTPSGRKLDPPPGRCWLYTRERFDEMVADNRIWFGEHGDNVPRLKKFLSEVQVGLVPTSIWRQQEVGTTGTAKAEIQALAPDLTPFSTPKPERLVERIVHINSAPGDLVLDCFAGSGTTAAVAHKLGRRWVTVELSGDTIERFVLPRLRKVVDGDDAGGITDAVEWTGGGGFTEARVAPSMFETIDGTVVLSDWATNGPLAEMVAAQLKFTPENRGPFAGRKGRTRLAVIDGMLTIGVADHLLDQLGERENLVVVAMTLEDGVEEQLRKQRPGSRARKVPRDLARSGKLPSRLVRLDQASGRQDR